MRRRSSTALLAAFALIGSPTQAAPVDLTVEITGAVSIVFDAKRDGCTDEDMPDVNPRAFRRADGQVAMFALHDSNHPLVGPDLAHLVIDCHSALASPNDPDPAHFDDRNFVTSTWTGNGRDVAALVHEEYHADAHDRCRASGDLPCWYNTILAYRSHDGGRDFTRDRPGIVAVAPYRQEVEQGRHRGFFNPSNIVGDGRWVYALISTTGWDGQPFGDCLFRSADPGAPGSWRAYDGRDFTIRYDDPYAGKPQRPKPCATLGPFSTPVGSLVKHRPSGTWIALFQAAAGGPFPLDGLYYATSADLLHWGLPKILLAGKTLYSDLCTAGPSIINYPAMLDPAAPGRNFDTVGDHPDLYLTTIDIEACRTRDRLLVREGLTIRHEGNRP